MKSLLTPSLILLNHLEFLKINGICLLICKGVNNMNKKLTKEDLSCHRYPVSDEYIEMINKLMNGNNNQKSNN